MTYVLGWGRHRGDPVTAIPGEYLWWLAQGPVSVKQTDVRAARDELCRRLRVELAR